MKSFYPPSMLRRREHQGKTLLFKHLKMTGFKSFAESAEVAIDDGLTGIVGPNGCGKSNIVEGLRWLMGESSAKSMRGSDLEDVVFNGTASRPSRNFAEVALVLDNAAMTAPAPYTASPEIEITRRLERGKGSTFRINGKAVRSKDTQLLFADMATGARSSGIVSQGKIEALINAKPLERRNLLEEAANISGLHQRRHEAELRLNTADNNLERLEDILIQLDEQKTALQKQARQAVRYRSIADRIRRADAHLLLARITLAMARLGETEAEMREATRIVAAATEAASTALRQREDAAESLPPLRQTEATISAERQRLLLARGELDNEEARTRRAADDLAARQEQIATDITREGQLLNDAEEALAALEAEAERLTREDTAERPRLTEAARHLNDARHEADEAEKALADAAARSRAAERERENLSRRQKEMQERHAHAAATSASINLEALRAEKDAATSAKATAEKAAAALHNERDRLESSLDILRQKQHDTAAAHSEAREALGRTRAEAEALASLLTLADKHASTPVSQAITIAPGYEEAVAATLGEALAAPLAPAPDTDDDTAPHYWRNLEAAPPPCPEGATPLADYVEAPAALRAALGGIGLVSTQAEAAAMQPGLAPGQMLTTPGGGMWRWDGFVARGGGESAASRRLRQEARLRAIEGERGGLIEAAEAAEAAARHATTERNTAEAALTALRQREQEADKHLNACLREDDRLTAEAATATTRMEEMAAIGDSCEAALVEITAEIKGLEDTAALDQQVTELTTTAEDRRKHLAEAMGAEREIAAARRLRGQRQEEISRESGLWRTRQQGARERLDELKRRQEAATLEADNLAGVPEHINQQREVLAAKIEEVEARQQEAADNLAAGEAALQQAENTLREADRTLAATREELIRHESAHTLAQQEQTTLVERIRERLNAGPQDLATLAGLTPDDVIDTSDEAIAALESRYERLLRERDNVGPVNLRAEDEMKEVEGRIQGLETERDDLIAAIRKLRLAIGQINREGRERLLKSFADVNRSFGVVFNALFDGGAAEIALTEDDDPLEAGLEILASPPGKRLQTLSLLSGGEKALTAIALIFAVFLTNPAPICVLDEVDAPLDDTNVGRFCDMLDQIANKTGTRFIIVTHHRLTMARMDRLYGITMEQKGVSRIVSVDLQTAERYEKSA